MGKGYLRIKTFTANGAVNVDGVLITILDYNNEILYERITNEYGEARDAALEAPDKSLTQYPNPPRAPYNRYKLIVRAPGYTSMFYEGVMIFDTTTSILQIELDPVVLGREEMVKFMYIEGHKLYNTETPQQIQSANMGMGIVPTVLPEVTIPNFIRVHLANWDKPANVVRVKFIDYIKNVVSHEIHDDWPEQTIMANLYCIISLTLNRVYTEFYRKKGKDFDITSETYMDQKFIYGGIIKARLAAVVDKVFNHHLAIIGHKEPFLALYNDGVKVNLPGRLSQWGSKYDGNHGMTAWQIIKKYYMQNLELRICDNFGGVLESYPGYTLVQGTRGDAVRTMQLFLNAVLGHYTNVIINPVDGIFGASTRNAVLTAQQLWGLPQTGEIDRRTWYEISRRFAVKRALWEMYSEGQRIGIGTIPPTQVVRSGNISALVVELQFLIDFIAMYHAEIPFVPQSGRFDSYTEAGVKAFQRLLGLTVDGIVGATTWSWLYSVYWGIMQNTKPPEPPPTNPPPTDIPSFPGTSLRVGSVGNNVRLVQNAINKLAGIVPGLWRISEDGVFGNGTRDVVMAFQRIFGLTVDGIVGPATWRRLMEESHSTGGSTQIPPFPGNLSFGSYGNNIRLVQEAINKIAPYHPGRLWILSVDGIFGNMTRDAIFSFQSVFGMPITGVVNQATWNRLMQEAINVSRS